MAKSRPKKTWSLFRLIVVAASVAGLLVFPLARSAEAHGQCYSGVNLMEVQAGGGWHWYAYVPVNVSAPITSWHVHGPMNPSLWPDSARGRYVMVYFSWPHGVNPYLKFKASDWQACVGG